MTKLPVRLRAIQHNICVSIIPFLMLYVNLCTKKKEYLKADTLSDYSKIVCLLHYLIVRKVFG